MIYASEWALKKYLAAEGVLISDTGKLNTTYSCILLLLHRPWKPHKYRNCCEMESGHFHDEDDLCFEAEC